MTLICPVCEATSKRTLFPVRGADVAEQENTYAIVQCVQCSLISLQPQPSDTTLARVYDARYYTPHAALPFGRLFDRLFTLWRRRRMRLLTRIKPQGTVLDIGCGAGGLVRELLTAGYDARGMDTARALANILPADLRPRITLAELDACHYPAGNFDIIMLSDVLEHVRNPRELLREVRRILKDDGQVIISVPNWSCAEARVFGHKHWRNLDVPRHLWHFTHASLSALLRRTGFTHIAPFEMGIVKLLEAPLILVHGWRSFLDERVNIPMLRSLLLLIGVPFLLLATPVLRLVAWKAPHQIRVAARKTR